MISAAKRPQTYTLDQVVTGIGADNYTDSWMDEWMNVSGVGA
jgi:hypothetical protein